MSSLLITDSPPSLNHKSVIYFGATWHESSAITEQLYQALVESTTNMNNTTEKTIVFYHVEAETVPNICQEYNVTVVPTFVLLHSDNRVFERIEGVDDVPKLTQAVSDLRQAPSRKSKQNSMDSTGNSIHNNDNNNEIQNTNNENEADLLNKKIQNIIHSSPVVLVMKGTPSQPKCGFSRQAAEMLASNKIQPFATFDILTNPAVRQGLKVFCDWPTYPMLFVKGELLGGLDIMKEMQEEREFTMEALGLISATTTTSTTLSTNDENESKTTLEDRLKALIQQKRIMLFMKGNPSQPKCGFSASIVELLDSFVNDVVSYDTFGTLFYRQQYQAY